LKPAGSHTLWIGDIAIDVSEQDLFDVFESCGEIEMIRLHINKLRNGQFGHIRFCESESVDKAVDLSGRMLKGSAIRLDFTEDRPPAAWPLAAFRPGRNRGNSAPGVVGHCQSEQAHKAEALREWLVRMKACEAEQARNAEEAQKALEAKEEAQKAVANEKAAKSPSRRDSPPRRIDEDENPFANFKASSSAWLPRRNDILGLDPQLSLAAAAEEAEKKADTQAELEAELEAAKKEKIFRFYDDLRRHSLNHPVAIVNHYDELEAAKKEKIARFYAALR
jgi:RNA recognition motif-containing protein